PSTAAIPVRAPSPHWTKDDGPTANTSPPAPPPKWMCGACRESTTTGPLEEHMIKGIGLSRRAFRLSRALGLATVIAVLGIGGCSDNNNLIVPITGLVTTFKDSNFNFATLHTFAMPDTVARLVPLTGTPLPITGQFDAVALNQVRTNLLARGYTDVSNTP